LPSGEKYFSLNGGVGQSSYLFSEERNVNHELDRKKGQWKKQRGKAVIHRAIGKVGQKTDEAKNPIEAKKATKCT
jgi:hypothetical protein